ncbi:MAG: exodeoxyribonuclease VII large subunit [Clostridium sp.]|nr:exodeoxyribonuclease VII large subunit [Prevotella sp.]MCM1428884.1 exodeoxyribonuclease VII large subunit [Clostridium sp.]MCM1475263.1 exodeoxyribonuclease VII large subunit [Muribaculaceae bacterium]
MNNYPTDGGLFAEDTQRRLTLQQYSLLIGRAIATRPDLRGAWVTAELMDLRLNGGHCYMELIEKDDAGRTVAKMRAMIWRSNLDRIRRKFIEATGRDIATGLKVMVRCTAGHHPLYGLAATIDDIDPGYTLGDYERIRREILERLKREGILERNKQLSLPVAAQRIAIISSSTAAGYGDFIDQLYSNPSGFQFYTALFPAIMQGEQTAASVRAALERIEMVIDMFDCVVIIRGGGATTDMNGFDDYELARDVATFALPVVVGIGHERDNCVLDYIANVRCKTPTAVASFLIEQLNASWQRAAGAMQQIARLATERIEGEKRINAQMQTMLASIAQGKLERENLRLRHLGESIPMSVGKLTAQASARLESNLRLISVAAQSAISRQRDKLENLERMTQVLSPANTLKRGYSITMVDGHAVSDAEQLRPGVRLETRLSSGKVVSVVETKY